MDSNFDNKMPMRGVFYALLASFLFGITTPMAKALLQDTMPILLAGLFYLGSGVGLALCLLLGGKAKLAESGPSLKRADFPWLAGAVFAGGIVAPVLLMLGLATA